MRQRYAGFFFRLAILFLVCLVLLLCVVLKIPCLFRACTGVPCPSCGMSRAWLAIIQCDPLAAFSYHPMFWLIPVLAVFLLIGQRAFSKPGRFLFLGLLVAYLICYILRLSAYLKGDLIL